MRPVTTLPPGPDFVRVPGWPNYWISPEGAVWSQRGQGRMMACAPNRGGYPTVVLCRAKTQRKVTLHRLVLETFVGVDSHGRQIRHLDSNRMNAKLSNLQYGTALENAADRDEAGHTARGSKHHSCRLSLADVEEVRARLTRGESDTLIAADYGVSRTAIYHVRTGRNWRAA